MDQDTLRVHPNPYTFVDHKGRAAGTFPVDTADHFQDRDAGRKVGSRVDGDKTKILSTPAPGEIRGHIQDTVHEYDAEPVVLPRTHHYMAGIRSGALIPADEATAAAVGMKFVQPGEALAKARHAAIAQYRAQYGEDPAFANEACPVAGHAIPKPPPLPSASNRPHDFGGDR